MICKMLDYICIIPYTDKIKYYLEEIATLYEGKVLNRIAYNFPLTYANKHIYKNTLFGIILSSKHEYCISCKKGNDFKHEVLHAIYFKEHTYRNLVSSFYNSLENKRRIKNILTSLGYQDHVLVDEFQAYYFCTEKDFGLHKLSKATLKNKTRCIHYLNNRGIRF